MKRHIFVVIGFKIVYFKIWGKYKQFFFLLIDHSQKITSPADETEAHVQLDVCKGKVNENVEVCWKLKQFLWASVIAVIKLCTVGTYDNYSLEWGHDVQVCDCCNSEMQYLGVGYLDFKFFLNLRTKIVKFEDFALYCIIIQILNFPMNSPCKTSWLRLIRKLFLEFLKLLEFLVQKLYLFWHLYVK